MGIESNPSKGDLESISHAPPNVQFEMILFGNTQSRRVKEKRVRKEISMIFNMAKHVSLDPQSLTDYALQMWAVANNIPKTNVPSVRLRAMVSTALEWNNRPKSIERTKAAFDYAVKHENFFEERNGTIRPTAKGVRRLKWLRGDRFADSSNAPAHQADKNLPKLPRKRPKFRFSKVWPWSNKSAEKSMVVKKLQGVGVSRSTAYRLFKHCTDPSDKRAVTQHELRRVLSQESYLH